jgi:hypothetical protein
MPLKKALSININIYGLIVHLITTNFIKQANFSLPIAFAMLTKLFFKQLAKRSFGKNLSPYHFYLFGLFYFSFF